MIIHRPAGNAIAVLTLAIGSLFVCSTAVAQGPYAVSTEPPGHLATGYASIAEAESEKWLSILVGDGFDGRGTGQEGYVRAAHFVAGKLAEYGFKPIGDDGTYFQNLPFFTATPDVAASSIQVGDIKLAGEEQIGFTQFGETARVSGDLVVLKATGNSAQIGDAESVSGKIVLVIEQDTGRLFQRSLFRARPAAVIRVAADKPSSTSRTLRGDSSGLGGGMVAAEISPEVAEALSKNVDGVGNLSPREEDGVELAGSDVLVEMDVKVIKRPITVPNVVGWYEGSDPDLKHEHIILGAHLDHLGVRGDAIYPGADDNGSGSTAILQVAQAMHLNGEKPKRSMLFIWFAAEEIGLVGSRHYANNPIMPLEDCICMLNIDMIGRNEEKDGEAASENEDTIHLVGSQRASSQLHELVLKANESVGFKFEYDEERTVFGRSDQASFAAKGIPVTFLFGGFNPHYHQTSDTMEGINFSKIANAARLNYLTAMMAADHGRFKIDVEE